MTANPAHPHDQHEGSTMAIDRVIQCAGKAYELTNGKWFYAGGDRVSAEVQALLAEVCIFHDSRPRPRIGWEENLEQAKRIRELEAELQSAKELNQRTAEIEAYAKSETERACKLGDDRDEARNKLVAANKLVDYHRGMATEYRGELSKALEKGKALEANERLVDYWRAQCFHGDPESLLGKMSQWAGDLAELIGIPRRRWTCDVITERIHKLNAMAARDIPQLEGLTVGKGHPLDPTPRIVDGTGNRGTAPAEASPREIAQRAAVDTLQRLDDKPQAYLWEHMGIAIAAGVEAYHQAQQEERDG